MDQFYDLYQPDPVMEASTKAMISVNELKRLLYLIVEGHLQICIRFRLLGQLWHPNFLSIVKISEETGILFRDDAKNGLIALPDLTAIIQFELDSQLYAFEPNFHYQVTTNENYKQRKDATGNYHNERS